MFPGFLLLPSSPSPSSCLFYTETMLTTGKPGMPQTKRPCSYWGHRPEKHLAAPHEEARVVTHTVVPLGPPRLNSWTGGQGWTEWGCSQSRTQNIQRHSDRLGSSCGPSTGHQVLRVFPGHEDGIYCPRACSRLPSTDHTCLLQNKSHFYCTPSAAALL